MIELHFRAVDDLEGWTEVAETHEEAEAQLHAMCNDLLVNQNIEYYDIISCMSDL